MTHSRFPDSTCMRTKLNIIKRTNLMSIKFILWYIKFTLAQVNRRSAVTLVGTRLVPTAAFRFRTSYPQSLLKFRRGAACGASYFVFTYVEIALCAGQMKSNDIQRSMS